MRVPVSQVLIRVALLALLALPLGVATAAPTAAPEPANTALTEADRIYSEVEAAYGEGRYEDALPLMQRVYDLRRVALGPQHADTLSNLIDLGLLNDLLGRYAVAEPIFLEAIAAHRAAFGERDPNTLKARSDYAQMLGNMTRFREAAAINEPVLALRREVLGPDAPETLLSNNNLADNYTGLGRFEEALTMQRAGLAISERVLGADDFNSNITRSNVAFVLERLGRPQEALPLAEDALERMTRTMGTEHPHRIRQLQRLGNVYGALNRWADAVPLFREVTALDLALLGQRNPDTLYALNDLAVALDKSGQREEALALRLKVMPEMQEVWGPTHRDTLTARNNLAHLFGELGQHAEALAIEQDVLALRTAASGPDHPDVLDDQRTVGLSLRALGRNDEALALLQRSLAGRRAALGERHPDTLESSYSVGSTLALMGRDREALPLMEATIRGVEALRASGDLAAADRQALFAHWADRYASLSALLLRTGAVPRAFEIAELSRARTLLEGTALRQATESGVLDAAELSAVRGHEQRLATLDRQLAALTEVSARVAVERERNQVVREYAALRRELGARHPKYARLQGVRVLGPKGARGVLSRGALFVSYVIDGDQVLAFTVDAKGQATGRALGKAPWLATTADAWRRVLAAPTGLKGLLQEGQKLWRAPDGGYVLAERAPVPEALRIMDAGELGRALGAYLLAPLGAPLRAAEQLIISPTGVLAVLPFETLEVEGAPLIAAHQVSYAQSLSVLALTSATAGGSGRMQLLGMGGADYASMTARFPAALDASRGVDEGLDSAYRMLALDWTPLPGSAAEVHEVAALFPPASVDAFLGADATEATLRRLSAEGGLDRYRYLLFSAHGFLSTVEPGLSALVLGRTGTASDADGYITASEWPALRLKSELVVLSACETGLGALVQGEGVTGLPYALAIAGNRSTVLSLWSVVDESTKQFMTRFFTRLRAGEAPAAALAAVKREFRASAEWSAPVHWAPFVLYGI